MLDSINKTFFDDEVFAAHKLLLSMGTIAVSSHVERLRSAGKLKHADGTSVEVTDKAYRAWKASDLRSEILTDISTIEKMLKVIRELESQQYEKYGWQPGTAAGTSKLFYRKASGLATLDVASECIIHQHIFKPLSLFSEVDLYANWIPRLKYLNIEKSYSRFRKTVHCEVDFPWPFNSREGVLHGYGTALPEEKAVMVILRTLPPELRKHLDCVLPVQKEEKSVGLTVYCGCFYFKYIDENTCFYRSIFNTNPHMSLVPDMVLNFAMKKVVFSMLKRIQERCSQFEGSAYEKRVRENSYLYDEIRRRLSATVPVVAIPNSSSSSSN